MSQLRTNPPRLFVRFEQARGQSGVPKLWLPHMVGHPDDPYRLPTIETLVRLTVVSFRVLCADSGQGHGEDWMPGSDDEYALHNIDGGRIEATDQIKWETIEGEQRAELVLTWRNPAALLRAQAT